MKEEKKVLLEKGREMLKDASEFADKLDAWVGHVDTIPNHVELAKTDKDIMAMAEEMQVVWDRLDKHFN